MMMHAQSTDFPELGFGLGLRAPHYAHIFEHWPSVDWFEIISENFMDTQGRPLQDLARIAERYPIVMHGVGMSIGSVDALDANYVRQLKKLSDWVKPQWISDHLCWTGMAHKNTHDLLPMPYTEEALAHIVARIKQVQDMLARPIALENPSTYLEFQTSHILEAEFIARMAEESGCHLLLDINNLYVSCYNHRLDPKAYLDALPLDRVIQIHLSGHRNHGTHIIDTHDDHVIDPVWALYQYAIYKADRLINTMVEWDDQIPPFAALEAELDKAKAAALSARDHGPLPNFTAQEEHVVVHGVVPLAEAQARMQDAIMRGAGIDSKPDEWIRPKPGFTPAAQLGVYLQAYRMRLYDATADDYPVLRHALGDTAYDRLLRDFVNVAQSDHFNLGRYGTKLPDFLARHPLNDAFAQELCLLEQAIAQLAHAVETAALTPSHLAGISPEVFMESVLLPRAALQLFAFDYPVNHYYRAVKEHAAPAKPPREKTFLAVFRHDDEIWRMDLDAVEYRLLRALFRGIPIGEALEQLDTETIMSEEQRMMHFTNCCARWMRNGLLATYESYHVTEREPYVSRTTMQPTYS